MKILFLDFDGVLNSKLFYDRRPSKAVELDREAVEMLNELTRPGGPVEAKVVVSSTWRIGKTREELQAILDEYGFKGEVIGKTKNYKSSENPHNVRGVEIKGWISENRGIVSSYCILDDDSDMLMWQAQHFVQTDHWTGITPTNVYKARRILNKTDAY